MTDQREKTFTMGLLGGGEEHEANMRRKLVAFLNRFRTVAEMENFLHDIDKLSETNRMVREIRTELDDMQEAQDRRDWLLTLITSSLKWMAGAAAGTAAIAYFWNVLKTSLGGPP